MNPAGRQAAVVACCDPGSGAGAGDTGGMKQSWRSERGDAGPPSEMVMIAIVAIGSIGLGAAIVHKLLGGETSWWFVGSIGIGILVVATAMTVGVDVVDWIRRTRSDRRIRRSAESNDPEKIAVLEREI